MILGCSRNRNITMVVNILCLILNLELIDLKRFLICQNRPIKINKTIGEIAKIKSRI